MPTPPQALVVFADPALQRSRLSRRVGNAARTFPDVQVQDLYELYPDFYIDAHSERQLLKGARLVIFSFQLAWYGMPSLLKEWFDAVIKPEWARLDGAGCLHGKRCWAIVDCNGFADDYRPGGRHARPLEDYLLPLEQTVRACGMDWLGPHVYYGADQASVEDIDAHVAKLRKMIGAELGLLPLGGEAHGA
jgi:putative NADPH-quinone reductase